MSTQHKQCTQYTDNPVKYQLMPLLHVLEKTVTQIQLMHENIYLHLFFYIYFFTPTHSHLLTIYHKKIRK